MNRYSFQLLRYVPNTVSQEFYNIGVFLFDELGKLVDARFVSDFRRLQCHPLADLNFLESLRQEFEESRGLGEGFAAYAEEMRKNLSDALQLTEQHVFWGREKAVEIDRLYHTYVATPSRETERGEDVDVVAGTRRALRRAMEDTFRRYHLLGNGQTLQRDVKVNYGGTRLQFTFDYSYQPNGAVKYLQGLALRNDVNEASRLCFVIERIRARAEAEVHLTAVVDDQILGDTRELLQSSAITTCNASQLDGLAMQIRKELKL